MKVYIIHECTNEFVKLPFCQLLISISAKKLCDVHVNSYNVCDINRGLGSGYCVSAMLQCFDVTYIAMVMFVETNFKIKADHDRMESKQEITRPCWLLSG